MGITPIVPQDDSSQWLLTANCCAFQCVFAVLLTIQWWADYIFFFFSVATRGTAAINCMGSVEARFDWLHPYGRLSDDPQDCSDWLQIVSVIEACWKVTLLHVLY